MTTTVIVLTLLGNLLEFIACLITFYKFKQLRNSSLRFIIIVIPFIFITEMYALYTFIKLTYFSDGPAKSGNFIYYNVTTIITLVLYYALYLENIKVYTYKRIFFVACVITFCFCLINVFYIQTGQMLHTYSFSIGSVCLCLGIVFYIKEIIESDKIILISKDPLFWISMGLFAFYIIHIPYIGMYNYLHKNYIEILLLFRNIFLVLNYIMYSCIIIGLLCLKK
jgi:hypothetical protein